MQTSKWSRVAYGIGFSLTAILIIVGVFVGLPTRYAPVDVGSGILGAVDLAAGVALVSGWSRFPLVARVASWISIAFGVTVIFLLASAAGYLKGAYGAVGQGGALIFVFVIALLFPYLVAMPAACLVWIGPRAKKPAAVE